MTPPTPPATPPPEPKARAPITKATRSLVITLVTKLCYRESKFPQGHPQRACHVGLVDLDPLICTHCTWYGSAGDKPVAVITGPTIQRVADALKTIKDEAGNDVTIRPKTTTWHARVAWAWHRLGQRLGITESEAP